MADRNMWTHDVELLSLGTTGSDQQLVVGIGKKPTNRIGARQVVSGCDGDRSIVTVLMPEMEVKETLADGGFNAATKVK